jgi:hypothetical protein
MGPARYAITLLAGALLFAPAPAAAQRLAERMQVTSADGVVRFTFESRDGVCGDGRNISIHGSAVTGGKRTWNNGLRECREGPVTMLITRRGGAIEDARASVGGTGDEVRSGVDAARGRAGDARVGEAGGRTGDASAGIGDAGGRVDVDLGAIDPADAVAYLLSRAVLESATKRAADRMVFAATLADAESWPALLDVAKAQSIPAGARKSAVFWLAQEAGVRATEGLHSIAGDDSDEIEVRRQAVFALSQVKADETIDALIDIARSNREPEIRKSAMFWLGQSDSPRAIAFFEEILRG